jgi:ATP-binding cassette, subfamily B, multidrug efflux pump
MFKDVSKNKRGLWKSFYSLQVKKHWLMYMGGILAVLFTNATEVMVPKFSQWAVDYVSKTPDALPAFLRGFENPLYVIGVALILNITVAFFMRAAWRQFLGKRTHYAARKIKKQIWNSLSKQNMKVFSDYPMGDLINRSITDVNPAKFILGFTIVMTSDIVFFTVLALGMMLSIDVYVAMSVIVVFITLPMLVYPVLKKEYDLHEASQKSMSRLSDSIAEMISSVRLQRVAALEKPWLTKLSSESKDYSARVLTLEKTAWSVFPISNGVVIAAYLMILIVGFYRFSLGHLTAGEFVALVALVSLVSGPITEIAANILEWQKGFSSLDRICEILQLEELEKTNAAFVDHCEVSDTVALSIENLCFSYRANSPHILKNISVNLDRSESLGIMGRVGTGKTTLLNIIAGLEAVQNNKVFIHGRDIKSLTRKQITEMVSYVSQSPFLFAGSIRENLSLNKNYDDLQLWDILEKVGLKQEFKSQPDGLETQIGEWGLSLSGGQKQRLALARNLLRPKPIMLFDDCLSAVDTKTEALIQRSIAEVASDSALIWVAHRESTLETCTRLLRLNEGNLYEV